MLSDKQQKALEDIKLIEELGTDERLVLFNHIKENKKQFSEIYDELNKKYGELEQAIEDIELLEPQKGEKGDKGDKGEDGKDGKDGKDGIDGKDGKDGIDGKDGEPGRDGLNGKDGVDGKDGKNGEKPRHEWKGQWIRFEEPDGKMGPWINLQGPKGESGRAIFGGGGGSLKVNGFQQVKKINVGTGLSVSGNNDEVTIEGTPVVAETDPVWTAEKVNYLTADEIATLLNGYLTLTGGTMTGRLDVADGSYANLGIGFAGNNRTGWFRGSDGRIEFLVGGITALQLYPTQALFSGGSIAEPGLSFNDETTTGIAKASAGVMDAVVAGNSILKFEADKMTASQDIRGKDIVKTRTISITRDVSGYITEIAKTGGRTITITRDASNYITSYTDSINTWTMTRDLSNYITAITVT